MIAGGSGYPLAELALLSPLPVHSSGFAPLDLLTRGGLAPGALWAVAGPPSVGVTTLVTTMALAVGSVARVALANDHMATHLLRDRLRSASDQIEIASWIPLPDYRSGESSWFGVDYDVLIIDCYDEMLRPAAWPKKGSAMRQCRWLRELARRSNTALVLTAHVERARTPGRRAFERAWQRHWVRPALDDTADVQVQLWPDAKYSTRFLASARGYGHATGSTHKHAGKLTLQAD